MNVVINVEGKGVAKVLYQFGAKLIPIASSALISIACITSEAIISYTTSFIKSMSKNPETPIAIDESVCTLLLKTVCIFVC